MSVVAEAFPARPVGNRFHPPRLRRPIAVATDETPAIDDLAFVTFDPLSQLATINVTAFARNIVQHFVQIRRRILACRSALRCFAHHRRCVAKHRLPGLEKPVQIVRLGATVNDLLNMAALAAIDIED